MSATTRKHVEELVMVLRRRFADRPFGTSFMYRKLLMDVRAASDRVCMHYNDMQRWLHMRRAECNARDL
jgi:hypothetical protein